MTIYIGAQADLNKVLPHIHAGNQKIQAIKELRGVTKLDLRDAKDVIDNCPMGDPTFGTGELLGIMCRLEEVVVTSSGATFAQREPSIRSVYGGRTHGTLKVNAPAETDQQVIMYTNIREATLMLNQLLKAQMETNELLKDLIDTLGD